jgi:hypothetical protein
MRKYLYGFAVFVLAFGILSVSVLRSASVSYVFALSSPSPSPVATPGVVKIDYQFPFPGKIMPDSPFWSLKAGRDILWYKVTFNHSKKAEMALLFSDKRLILARSLFENKKPDVGLSTLTKGEKYLEMAVNEEGIARSEGADTGTFLVKLATAALKHRETIEETLIIAPEDIRPEMIKAGDYSKNVYKAARDALNSKGIPSPKDPFDGR